MGDLLGCGIPSVVAKQGKWRKAGGKNRGSSLTSPESKKMVSSARPGTCDDEQQEQEEWVLLANVLGVGLIKPAAGMGHQVLLTTCLLHPVQQTAL